MILVDIILAGVAFAAVAVVVLDLWARKKVGPLVADALNRGYERGDQ